MMPEPWPPLPEIVTGPIKLNGVTTNGGVVIGFGMAYVPVTVAKTNQIISASGDGSVAPVTLGLIVDPDLLDAPFYQIGFR